MKTHNFSFFLFFWFLFFVFFVPRLWGSGFGSVLGFGSQRIPLRSTRTRYSSSTIVVVVAVVAVVVNKYIGIYTDLY